MQRFGNVRDDESLRSIPLQQNANECDAAHSNAIIGKTSESPSSAFLNPGRHDGFSSADVFFTRRIIYEITARSPCVVASFAR